MNLLSWVLNGEHFAKNKLTFIIASHEIPSFSHTTFICLMCLGVP